VKTVAPFTRDIRPSLSFFFWYENL
jgi:hypothetical protein